MTLRPPMSHHTIDASRSRPATVDRQALRIPDVGDATLASSGLMAAPCRVAAAGLKIIPGVGGVLATPTDACAAAID